MQKRRFPTAYPTFVYRQTIRQQPFLVLVRRQTIRHDYKLFFVQQQTIRRDYKLILCSGKLFATTITLFCAAANYSPATFGPPTPFGLRLAAHHP